MPHPSRKDHKKLSPAASYVSDATADSIQFPARVMAVSVAVYPSTGYVIRTYILLSMLKWLVQFETPHTDLTVVCPSSVEGKVGCSTGDSHQNNGVYTCSENQ